MDMDMESENDFVPPINNALLPDIYVRLDANTVSRTKVANSLLDERLKLQSRVLTKYKLSAERENMREREKVRKEMKKIRQCLPDYELFRKSEDKKINEWRLWNNSCDDDNNNERDRGNMSNRSIRDYPSERDKSFCDRFQLHHRPSKAKFYRSYGASNVRSNGSLPPDIRNRMTPRTIDRNSVNFEDILKEIAIEQRQREMEINEVRIENCVADKGTAEKVETELDLNAEGRNGIQPVKRESSFVN